VKKADGFYWITEAEATAHWDSWLAEFHDAHFKQCLAWGEVKRAEGWQVMRASFWKNGIPTALAQITLRKAGAFPASIAWANGGPVVLRKSASAPENSFEEFLTVLRTRLKNEVGRYFLRVGVMRPDSVEAASALRAAGFAPAPIPLSTRLTCVVGLDAELDEIRKRLDKKWRNQLKASEKSNPSFVAGVDDEIFQKFDRLHRQMTRLKGLGAEDSSLETLRRHAAAFGDRFEIILAEIEGEPGSGACVYRYDDKAFLGLAATNTTGRKACLANALYWNLFGRLKRQGVRTFDLMGVDPQRAWGVYHFKRGTRGEMTTRVGEWDCASGPIMFAASNLAIWLRFGNRG